MSGQRLSLAGFPGGSESACNAGDLGLIPGSGRSPGEGIGYSLVAQLVKNPPAVPETWVPGVHSDSCPSSQ